LAHCTFVEFLPQVSISGRVINKKPFLYDFRYDEYYEYEITQEQYDYYLKLLTDKFPTLMDKLNNFEDLSIQKLEQIDEEINTGSFS
jgi:hypothetical protein